MTKPPRVDEWAGSPQRIPYVIPFAHDPMTSATLPACYQAPPAGKEAGPDLDRSEGFVRHFGVLPGEISGFVPDDGNVAGNLHLGQGPHALRWGDAVRCVPIEVEEVPLCWEVARQDLSPYAVATLERMATYLAAQPLDGQGQPTGPRFVSSFDTGLCDAVDHPDGTRLHFRWHLRHHGGEAPGLLVAQPPESLPQSLPPKGLPFTWSDWRYTWHGRYTEQMRALLSTRWLRLFVELRAENRAGWRIRAGGILTVWEAPVNPYDTATAERAASVR